MKAYRLFYRQAAKADLQAIFDDVQSLSRSDATARAYLRRLRDRCTALCDAPLGHPIRPELGEAIRVAVFEQRVVILYRVEADRVEIVALFWGSRDYPALMQSGRRTGGEDDR